MSNSRLTDITAEEIHRTEKAILINDGTKEVWIPLSICEIVEKGKRIVEITLPEHWAKKKGLI